jgi:thiamine kinase-like enzyme
VAALADILSLLEAELGPVLAEPQPLAGGITNHNFRIRFAERECVVRVTGSATELLGIDRQAERAAGEAAAALGIAPAVIAAGEGYLVTQFLDGRPGTARRLRAAPEDAARALRRFHDCGLELGHRFWVPELLEQYARVVADHGQTVPADYELARSAAGRIAEVLPLREPRPCHDDLLPANLLRDRQGQVMLVDWEYAGMGHPLFDLGNLAVNSEFDPRAETRLLEAYFGEEAGPPRRAALALMRIMSDAREAAWGVVQAVISELQFDFDAYSRLHFTRLRKAVAHHEFDTWLDVAASEG